MLKDVKLGTKLIGAFIIVAAIAVAIGPSDYRHIQVEPSRGVLIPVPRCPVQVGEA